MAKKKQNKQTNTLPNEFRQQIKNFSNVLELRYQFLFLEELDKELYSKLFQKIQIFVKKNVDHPKYVPDGKDAIITAGTLSKECDVFLNSSFREQKDKALSLLNQLFTNLYALKKLVKNAHDQELLNYNLKIIITYIQLAEINRIFFLHENVYKFSTKAFFCIEEQTVISDVLVLLQNKSMLLQNNAARRINYRLSEPPEQLDFFELNMGNQIANQYFCKKNVLMESAISSIDEVNFLISAAEGILIELRELNDISSPESQQYINDYNLYHSSALYYMTGAYIKLAVNFPTQGSYANMAVESVVCLINNLRRSIKIEFNFLSFCHSKIPDKKCNDIILKKLLALELSINKKDDLIEGCLTIIKSFLLLKINSGQKNEIIISFFDEYAKAKESFMAINRKMIHLLQKISNREKNITQKNNKPLTNTAEHTWLHSYFSIPRLINDITNKSEADLSALIVAIGLHKKNDPYEYIQLTATAFVWTLFLECQKNGIRCNHLFTQKPILIGGVDIIAIFRDALAQKNIDTQFFNITQSLSEVIEEFNHQDYGLNLALLTCLIKINNKNEDPTSSAKILYKLAKIHQDLGNQLARKGNLIISFEKNEKDISRQLRDLEAARMHYDLSINYCSQALKLIGQNDVALKADKNNNRLFLDQLSYELPLLIEQVRIKNSALFYQLEWYILKKDEIKNSLIENKSEKWFKNQNAPTLFNGHTESNLLKSCRQELNFSRALSSEIEKLEDLITESWQKTKEPDEIKSVFLTNTKYPIFSTNSSTIETSLSASKSEENNHTPK